MNSNKQTKSKRTIKRKPRVLGRRLPNNRRRRRNIIRGRKIAAASAKTFVKKFRMLRQNGNSVRVTGRDLIYSIPDDLTSPIQNTNVITVIPANPAYWKGTRIAALASGYQNYRPIMFKITYIPMCAVTQQGNVIGGTIWDDGIDNDNLQQSLRTSNGGFMTQCYVPHTTRIRPKSNLQFNLYRMGGAFSTTSNPFIFIALAIGCKNSSNQRIIPGYFYVTWSFELKNPIGSINNYNNTGLITYNALNTEMNTTIININPNSEVPFGSYIDIEEKDDEQIALYNGTEIEIANSTPIWGFTSVTKTSNSRMVSKIPITYDGVTTDQVRLGDGEYNAYAVATDNLYHIYVLPTYPKGDSYKFIILDEIAFLISDNLQNFGTYMGVQTNTVVKLTNGEIVDTQFQLHLNHYQASKDLYVLQINNRKQENCSNQNCIRYKKCLLKTQEQPENINKQEPINDDVNVGE